MRQRELGLDSLDIVVLLNLTLYWWYRGQPPYLRTNLIAGRAGVSSRTIQRVIRKLQAKGYVRREKWTDAKGVTRPAIFFEGLIEKLEELTRADPILQERMNKALAKNASGQEMEVA
jgi:predicted ArsR family transcriptional regulator